MTPTACASRISAPCPRRSSRRAHDDDPALNLVLLYLATTHAGEGTSGAGAHEHAAELGALEGKGPDARRH